MKKGVRTIRHSVPMVHFRLSGRNMFLRGPGGVSVVLLENVTPPGLRAMDYVAAQHDTNVYH